mgnify:CR=1 FL=1
MMVVRCPSCQGLSRVETGTPGQLVLCPRCGGPFIASQDAPPISAASASLPPVELTHDDDHEPIPIVSPTSGTVPANVLFGLALLPFMIPLVWLLVPKVFGWEPVISLAAPIALAVTGSTLSLAVVSTIDWTPATRVKGVCMIVGLSFFSGTTLFFLKQDAIDWVKQNFGHDVDWNDFRPNGGRCAVRVPGDMNLVNDQPIQGWHLDRCFRLETGVPGDLLTYTIGFSTRPQKLDGNDWFQSMTEALKKGARATVVDQRPEPYNANHPGFEWTLSLPNGATRIVRVYRVKTRVYYLAVEGVNITPEDDHIEPFFRSFLLLDELR